MLPARSCGMDVLTCTGYFEYQFLNMRLAGGKQRSVNDPHLKVEACIWTLPQLCNPYGQQLWFHRPMHQGTFTKCPSRPSMPDKERYLTENVLPRHGILAWNPLRSVGKVPCRQTVSLLRGEVP